MKKADFVSVKDYVLEYGHNSKHVRIIRTRYDEGGNKTIQFFLIELDLANPRIIPPRLISPDEVMNIFKKYNPDALESHVQQFIRGELLWLKN